MALIEWTDANGHRWQADVTDDDGIAPEYLAASPRAQRMTRVSVKRGARWERSVSAARPSAQAPTNLGLLPAASVPESPVEVYGRRELTTAAHVRQSRLDNGGRWEPIATVVLRLRRSEAKRRTLPGDAYSGQDHRPR